DIVAEIQRGVEMLHRLAGSHSQENLKRFRDSLSERYEGREVPLAEALDDEAGVGFRSSGGPGADASPLLKGLHFPGSADETTFWGKRQALLFRKFNDALARRQFEIVLEKRDLEAFETDGLPPLPDS